MANRQLVKYQPPNGFNNIEGVINATPLAKKNDYELANLATVIVNSENTSNKSPFEKVYGDLSFTASSVKTQYRLNAQFEMFLLLTAFGGYQELNINTEKFTKEKQDFIRNYSKNIDKELTDITSPLFNNPSSIFSFLIETLVMHIELAEIKIEALQKKSKNDTLKQKNYFFFKQHYEDDILKFLIQELKNINSSINFSSVRSKIEYLDFSKLINDEKRLIQVMIENLKLISVVLSLSKYPELYNNVDPNLLYDLKYQLELLTFSRKLYENISLREDKIPFIFEAIKKISSEISDEISTQKGGSKGKTRKSKRTKSRKSTKRTKHRK